MQSLFRRFHGNDSGATAIEYSLIAAFIGIAIIGALQAVGVELSSIFVDVQGGLQKRVAV